MLYHILNKWKDNINICTKEFLIKFSRNTHVNYNGHFHNWSHVLIWYLWLLSSNTHSVFLSLLARNSTSCGSFLGGVIHTFIPDGSVTFVNLPILGCFKFPLTLIIGHRSTRRHPKGSPAFQTWVRYLSNLHCGEAIQYSHDYLDLLPLLVLWVLFFSCLLV